MYKFVSTNAIVQYPWGLRKKLEKSKSVEELLLIATSEYTLLYDSAYQTDHYLIGIMEENRRLKAENEFMLKLINSKMHSIGDFDA